VIWCVLSGFRQDAKESGFVTGPVYSRWLWIVSIEWETGLSATITDTNLDDKAQDSG
jgi:hypothetical protein